MTVKASSWQYRTLTLIAAAVVATAFFGTASAQSQSQTKKPTAAVYIMGDPEDRDNIRSAVFNYLVQSGKYEMVAIDAIDLLTKEHIRQENAATTVKIANYGKNAGAAWVCVVSISERKGKTYFSARMINVETKTAQYSQMADAPADADFLEFIKEQVYLLLSGISK